MNRNILSILMTTLLISSGAFAESYQNTPSDYEAFEKLVNEYRGELVCIPDPIYQGNNRSSIIQVIGNPALQEFRVTVTQLDGTVTVADRPILKTMVDVMNSGIITSFEASIDNIFGDIAIGKGREQVSRLSMKNTSSEYPFTAGFDHQFDNICKIVN